MHPSDDSIIPSYAESTRVGLAVYACWFDILLREHSGTPFDSLLAVSGLLDAVSAFKNAHGAFNESLLEADPEWKDYRNAKDDVRITRHERIAQILARRNHIAHPMEDANRGLPKPLSQEEFTSLMREMKQAVLEMSAVAHAEGLFVMVPVHQDVANAIQGMVARGLPSSFDIEAFSRRIFQQLFGDSIECPEGLLSDARVARAWLAQNHGSGLLRFVCCGAVRLSMESQLSGYRAADGRLLEYVPKQWRLAVGDTVEPFRWPSVPTELAEEIVSDVIPAVATEMQRLFEEYGDAVPCSSCIPVGLTIHAGIVTRTASWKFKWLMRHIKAIDGAVDGDAIVGLLGEYLKSSVREEIDRNRSAQDPSSTSGLCEDSAIRGTHDNVLTALANARRFEWFLSRSPLLTDAFWRRQATELSWRRVRDFFEDAQWPRRADSFADAILDSLALLVGDEMVKEHGDEVIRRMSGDGSAQRLGGTQRRKARQRKGGRQGR